MSPIQIRSEIPANHKLPGSGTATELPLIVTFGVSGWPLLSFRTESAAVVATRTTLLFPNVAKLKLVKSTVHAPLASHVKVLLKVEKSKPILEIGTLQR